MLLQDFNADDDDIIKVFFDLKQLLCFNNRMKLNCTDSILTNKPRFFQTTWIIETELPNFHRMDEFVVKMHFRQVPLKIISYINLKKRL